MKSEFTITDKEKCTGCFACMNICPKDAISVSVDELGKTVPLIDSKKCIRCDACKRVCPEETLVMMNNITECYAAWTKRNDDVQRCASGGVSTGIARQIIKQGGVVFGSMFDENLDLHIEGVEEEKKVEKFSGSKYVQSFTGFSFRKVKKALDENKWVYYAGTPCQIAGLKNYLKKDYERLILVDLICHGVPPIDYLKSYVKSITKVMPEDIVMRNERGFQMILKSKRRIVYKRFASADYYYYAFLNAISYRDNCYSCQYAKKKRCSDITLGDFWGIDRQTLREKYMGNISVVLINTEKGKKIWDNVKNEFNFEKRTIQEAVNGNSQLKYPSQKHQDRKEFENVYKEKGFNEAVRIRPIKQKVQSNRIRVSIIYRTINKLVNLIKV